MSALIAQSNKNGFAKEKVLRIWLLSLILALAASGITALALAWIMVRQKLPLFAAIPMASISVGIGSFCAGIIQGASFKQKGSLSSVITAFILAALCILAGFPSWQPPYFTANAAARTAVILIAAVLGCQLGKKLCPKAKRHSRRGRK